MKLSVFALAGCAALMVTGCRPELAKEKFGEDDAQWANRIGENYRGYQAPRTYAPALVDKYESLPAAPAPAVAAPAADSAVAEETVAAPEPAAEQAAVKADAPLPAQNELKGEIYVVKSGDTLGSIAKKYYKDARRADLIYRVNSNVIKDANRVRPGTKLLIPAM